MYYADEVDIDEVNKAFEYLLEIVDFYKYLKKKTF
jgi:hypothetical protein